MIQLVPYIKHKRAHYLDQSFHVVQEYNHCLLSGRNAIQTGALCGKKGVFIQYIH
jgi:hypothetical protein